MTSPKFDTIIKMLENVPETIQERIFKEVINVIKNYSSEKPFTPSKGKTGKQVLQFAGLIPLSDLDKMNEAIEAGCEQIDANEW